MSINSKFKVSKKIKKILILSRPINYYEILKFNNKVFL